MVCNLFHGSLIFAPLYWTKIGLSAGFKVGCRYRKHRNKLSRNTIKLKANFSFWESGAKLPCIVLLHLLPHLSVFYPTPPLNQIEPHVLSVVDH